MTAKLRLKPTSEDGAQPREQELFSEPRYAGTRHLRCRETLLQMSQSHPLEMSRLEFARVQPRRLLEWREQDGRCVLLRPRLGSSRVGRWMAGLWDDPYYQIRLDEVGTLVWKACDGRTSLADIVGRMRDRFGDRVEPADQRLAEFMRKMLKGRMIAIRED